MGRVPPPDGLASAVAVRRNRLSVTGSLRRGGLLLPVLVLPLSIPTLIFGVISAETVTSGGNLAAPFSILCALSLVGLVIGPVAAAASLRHGRD